MFLFLPLVLFANENLIRIGGLDIPVTNYGSIRIGPHKNKGEARFANYYFELSTWICANRDGVNYLSDGDITKEKAYPDWYPYQRVLSDSSYKGDDNEIKYITVYRDDIEMEKHQPLDIEITQELYYKPGRDWSIILYQALKSTTGASYLILQQVRNRKIQIALSVPVFFEYQDVLTRDKSLKNFKLQLNDVEKYLRFIAYIGKTFEIYFLLRPNLKDEKDNKIVELAVTSQSDYLITSNIRDFKNAELKFDQLKIITPSEFVKMWRNKNA